MLKCVIFCEFDLKKGPVLKYQFPTYVNKEQFNTMSDILIPLPELCGKLITAYFLFRHIDDRDFVVGQPIIIVNDKYERQKIEFNLAFVLGNEEYQRLPLYENFIRKIAMQLTVLETFQEYISDDCQKKRLEEVCEELFIKLSDGSSHCCIAFNSTNILSLNYERKELLLPPPIEDWHVPVPLVNLDSFKAATTDLVVQKVLSSIDGRKYVKNLREEMSITDSSAKMCLKHLYYQGLIDFIDLFQVGNVYRVTEKISMVLNDLASESTQVLAKNPEVNEFTIFNYYCLLSDRSISEFLEENPEALVNTDVELLIAYGLLHGIIRRVHKFCIGGAHTRIEKTHYFSNDEKVNKMLERHMLTGNTSMDEICTYFDTQQRTIEGSLKDICVFYYK